MECISKRLTSYYYVLQGLQEKAAGGESKLSLAEENAMFLNLWMNLAMDFSHHSSFSTSLCSLSLHVRAKFAKHFATPEFI